MIGEKIEIGGFERLNAPFVGSCIHAGNKIATLVGLSANVDGADVVAGIVGHVGAVGTGGGVGEGFAAHAGGEADIAGQVGGAVVDTAGAEGDGCWRDGCGHILAGGVKTVVTGGGTVAAGNAGDGQATDGDCGGIQHILVVIGQPAVAEGGGGITADQTAETVGRGDGGTGVAVIDLGDAAYADRWRHGGGAEGHRRIGVVEGGQGVVAGNSAVAAIGQGDGALRPGLGAVDIAVELLPLPDAGGAEGDKGETGGGGFPLAPLLGNDAVPELVRFRHGGRSPALRLGGHQLPLLLGFFLLPGQHLFKPRRFAAVLDQNVLHKRVQRKDVAFDFSVLLLGTAGFGGLDLYFFDVFAFWMLR